MAELVWCNECQSIQEVVDQFREDTGDSRRVVEVYSVTCLDCGHQVVRQIGEYRSPLQQAGLPRSASLPDPFEMEGE